MVIRRRTCPCWSVATGKFRKMVVLHEVKAMQPSSIAVVHVYVCVCDVGVGIGNFVAIESGQLDRPHLRTKKEREIHGKRRGNTSEIRGKT